MHRRLTRQLLIVTALLLAISIAGCGRFGGPPGPPPPKPSERQEAQSQPPPGPGRAVAKSSITPAPAPPGVDPGTVTVGRASQSVANPLITACTSGRRTNFNPAESAIISAQDGSQWTVPAEVGEGPVAVDLFNDCTGDGDASAAVESQLKTVVIDPDGVEITGYVFADNYFELYVNGTLVGRDPIGFTPFNSNVVRFKARYPITYAVKLVDWETHPGIGLEYDEYRVGDGGFIAWFSDGTVTGSHWKAAPFYIAPLDDPACVDVGNGRDSSRCPGPPSCAKDRPDATCKALHFKIPADWTAPGFNDATWPAASVYRASDVTNQPAYAQYTQFFGSADFIWSRNLVLDNLVLARLRVESPPQ